MSAQRRNRASPINRPSGKRDSDASALASGSILRSAGAPLTTSLAPACFGRCRDFALLGTQGGLRLLKGERIARKRTEAEHRQALGEVRRKLGRHVDLAAVGSVNPDATSMEVQLAVDAPGQKGIRPAILRVAHDRMPDRRHVRPQLVRSPRQWLELDPGGAVAGAID